MTDLGLEPDFLRKLDQMAIVCRRMKAGRSQGTRRSPKKGSSVEFADFRNYSKGDDLRRVDWNAYARLDRLFVKLFIEEQDVALHVLVDQSTSMRWGDGKKFTLGCRLAASLGYIALAGYDSAGVGFLSNKIDGYYGPLTGKPSWHNLWSFIGEHMEGLAVAKDGSTPPSPSLTDLDGALLEFGARRPAKGVTMVVSDLFCKGYQAGVKALQASGQDVALLHVTSPDEMAPVLSGELKLVDSETHLSREVSITPSLLRAYAQRAQAYLDSVRRFCVSRGAAYVHVRSDEQAGEFIMTGLVAAGLVR